MAPAVDLDIGTSPYRMTRETVVCKPRETFAPSVELDADVYDALAWAEAADAHPLARALVLCHEVRSIHPFRDGSGCVRRALLHVQLHRAGYPGTRYAFVD